MYLHTEYIIQIVWEYLLFVAVWTILCGRRMPNKGWDGGALSARMPPR